MSPLDEAPGPDASPRPRSSPSGGEAGFTLLEMLIALLLLGFLLAAGVSLFRTSSELYTVQRESVDASTTLRGAGSIIATYLQDAAASDGDLTDIADHSFTVRALQAAGVICAFDTTGTPDERYGLQDVTGFFEATADDSMMIFDVDNSDWRVGDVNDAWNGADAYGPDLDFDWCVWGDGSSVRPEAAVELKGPPDEFLNEIETGAPLRAYRSTEVGLFTDGGETWLGRRIGDGDWEKIGGPTMPEADDGLRLWYYDETGATATAASAVDHVEVLLRSKSFGRTTQASGAVEDSVRLEVYLRNNEDPTP